MPYLDIILSALQWLILLIFIVIGFFVGRRRGFKKSYYYLITNFVLTLGVLIIVSLVSIRLFFPTAGDLLSFVTKYLSVSDNILNYIKNPNVSPVFFAIVDVFFKIILFIVIFPILKILLNILLFKPIYSLFFKDKSYVEEKNILKSLGLKGSLKKDHEVLSRVSGGILGVIRGLFASLVVFIPIIIISGTFTHRDLSNDNNLPTEIVRPEVLLNGTEESSSNNSFNEISNILDVVRGINTYGPGRFVKMIKTKNGTIDEEIFDGIFGGDIIRTVDGEKQKEKLRISKELNLYGTVFSVLLEDGYLEDSFDYKTINYEDDYKNIDYILNSLGTSQLVNLAAPIAIDVLEDEGIFLKELGFSIKDINNSELTYRNLQNIKWGNEFTTLSKVIENLLKIGSIDELETYIKDPDLFIQLDQTTKDYLTSAFAHLSELDLLMAGNIAVEYLLRNDSIVSKIEWVEEPELYAREQLNFVFTDKDFFKKELKVVNNLLKDILTDDFKDYNFKELFKEGKINIDHILTDGSRELFITGLENIIHFNTLKNLLPVGIDAAVYYSPITMGEQAREKLDEIIANIDYEEEINNVDNIYQNVITLGINNLLKGNPELIKEVDAILQKPESFSALKDIVNIILVESEFVGELVEYGSGRLIKKTMDDGPIKDFLLNVDQMEGFSYGLEIVNALKLAEDIYKVSDLTTVVEQLNAKKYLEIAADLSDLNDTEIYDFRENLLSFQMLDMLNYESINDLKTLNPMLDDLLIVPLGINKLSIKTDINMLLDIAFEAARQSKLNGFETLYIRNVNLENAFDKDALTEIFTFNQDEHENSMIFHSLVNQLQTKAIKLGSFGEIKVAPNYIDYDRGSEEWFKEVNTLVLGTLDLIDGIILSDNFTLTINNILSIKNLDSIKPELIYDLESSNSFNKLGGSYNARYNITKLMTGEGLSSTLSKILTDILGKEISNVNLKLEDEWLDSDGFFSNDEIKLLLKSVVTLDIKNFSNIGEELANKIFSLAKNNKLDDFYESNYMRVMASRFLISNTVKEILADSSGFNIEDLTFDITEKDNNGNLTKLEVVNIFKAFDLLGIDNPGNINISNKTLKDLTDQELTQVLESNYFYQLIDLSLKNQLDIPNGALVDDGSKYDGMIKKSEIKALIEALKILDIDEDINLSGIRLSQVQKLIDLNSKIIDNLISNEVKTITDVPEESKDLDDNIINSELTNLIEAISIVSGEEDPLLDSIDMSEGDLKLSVFDELVAIEDSPIINRLISESIITTFSNNSDTTILEGLLENNSKDIKRTEIIALNQSLKDLGLNEISSDVTSIEITNLIMTTANPSMSEIVRRLISNQTRFSLGNDDTSMVLELNSEYIIKDELNKLFKAINEIGSNLNITEIKDIEFGTLVFDKIISVDSNDSKIVRRLISNVLIPTSLVIKDIYKEASLKDITRVELTKFLKSSRLIDEITDINSLIAFFEDENKTISDYQNILDDIKDKQDITELSNILIDTLVYKIIGSI